MFAIEDIGVGELTIAHVGEVIKPLVSDVPERQYVEQSVGCYRFEEGPGEIMYATMTGNAARYINQRCALNCYSKTVWAERASRNMW